VERVIPRTPSIAGAAPSGFSGSSTAFVAAFPHCEVHAIRDRNTQYPFPLLLPRHCSRLWRDKAPLALPLCLEVGEPVVAVTLLILVQSPASE